MKTPDLTKLPKWAQDHIKDLERERFIAVRALREYTDNQTPSPFIIDEYESIGDTDGTGPASYRRYIQTHKITVKHAGVRLDVLLRDGRIDLQWGDENRDITQVCFCPRSFQAADLISKENMR